MDLEFEKSLLCAINEASLDGILVVDDKDVVVSHNHRFLEVWRIPQNYLKKRVGGNSAVGAPDQPILAFVVQRVKDPQTFLMRVKELYNDPTLDDHCEIELKDGRTVERHSTVLRGFHGKYLGRVWFFRDVTERKRTDAVLRDLAEHDPLTGVPNRRYFLLRFSQEFARTRRYGDSLSLVMIDIDHFKLINDKYGHAAGDEVLKTTCLTCRHQLREVDLLGRFGGEEFTVSSTPILEEPTRSLSGCMRQLPRKLSWRRAKKLHALLALARRLWKLLTQPIETMFQRADNAMYRAKEHGRNRVEDANSLLPPRLAGGL